MNLELSDPWCLYDDACYDDNNYEDTVMTKPEVRPVDKYFPNHRTGGLYGVTVREIEAVLGFPPNKEDDHDKVTASWAFEMNDHKCAIWDYKGSLGHNEVSTFGSDEVFNELFAHKYFKD